MSRILQPQGIELVSITDGSTAEPNPEDFSIRNYSENTCTV
jgi:hypothetical protein